MRSIACIVTTLLAAVLALSGGAAAAQQKKKKAPVGGAPMEVHVVRSAHPGCEPDCPQWIAAQGRIVPGSARKFRNVVRGLKERKLPIFIDSLGGSISDAYAIGRLVRSKGLTVVVTATTFSPCAPGEAACQESKAKTKFKPKTKFKSKTKSKAKSKTKSKTGGERRGLAQPYLSKCASACVFILAGGTRRLVGAGAAVGVHQGIRIERTYMVSRRRAYNGSIKTTKTLTWEGKRPVGRKANAAMRKYLAEMGISDVLMSLIEATPHERIRGLAGWELQVTRIATEYLNGEQLLAGTPAPPFPSPPTLYPTLPAPFPTIKTPSPAASTYEPGSVQDICFKLGRCERDGTPKDLKSIDYSSPLSRDSK